LLDITGAIPGEKFTFTCDASEAGWGEAKFDLVHRGRSLPHNVREVEKGIYMISFTPQERGKHRVYVYYNGIEVKGTLILIMSSAQAHKRCRTTLRCRRKANIFFYTGRWEFFIRRFAFGKIKKKSHGPMPKACELVTNQYADAMEWNKNPIH
jgi:hypothetical protein